ncbi:type II toxin-antitoxin system VapC family toxin [uncultured Thiodictyon sp.]|uniref:type II toxin-antitoxin system VapC family toxin n=1 Tax=uncultured Thiodictyon sp. TaxID=1846217 RepID=UPI0025FD7A1D|nr:type II toxin-antitoxin system VapC family toxin [uncultured Thiodictyon sp.]
MDALRYLLDTNILSALIRQPQGSVAAILARRGYGAVCTSIVVAAELRFGARKLGSDALTRKVDDLLATLPVLPLEADADLTYAEIRFQLEQAGTPIGPNDLLIAAHAVDLGLTLVTDNVHEFTRVSGLRVENWLDNSAFASQ